MFANRFNAAIYSPMPIKNHLI